LPLHEEQQLNLLGEKTIANRENLYSFVEEKRKSQFWTKTGRKLAIFVRQNLHVQLFPLVMM